jgi:hypothetical protein
MLVGLRIAWVPYSIRGTMYLSYVFPVDAEYEFRVRVNNHRDLNGVSYDAPLETFLGSLEAAKHGPTFQEGAAPQEGGGGTPRPQRAQRTSAPSHTGGTEGPRREGQAGISADANGGHG